MTLPRVSCSEKPITAVSTADVVIRPAIENPACLPTTMNTTSTPTAVIRSIMIRGSVKPMRGRRTRNAAVIPRLTISSSSNASAETSAMCDS